jgi:hypothetical protein
MSKSHTSVKSDDFSRLNCSNYNRFSELPEWAKKFTEPSSISVIQTKISNDVVPVSRGFATLPYNERRYAVNDYLKNHPEIKANPQVAVDNITLINVLMDYAEENGIESLGEIDWDELRSGGTYNELRGSMSLARKRKFEQMRLSKHPKEVGSVWVGGGFVHGPRIRQPGEFEFIKNVEPSPKFYHFKDAGKIPKSLPKGSKLVVGKLRESGEWALQSTIIPKTSKLGKSLIRR